MDKTRASVDVAIIEDIAEIREGLRVLIDGVAGYQCAMAFPSAEDALASLSTFAADVVLMDIGLPGMSGIEATKQIKSQQPDTQIIMLTVYEDNENIFDSLAAGATGYVLKNTPPNELIGALEQVIAGGSPMSGAIARRVVEHFRAPEQDPALATLSPRESEILDLLVQGIRFKEIAERLFISPETVRTHTRHIYEKLQVSSRAEAAAVVAGTKR